MRRVLAAIALAASASCQARDPMPTMPTPEPPASKPALLQQFGTRHPITVVATDPDHRWALACQARHDTEADGEISVLNSGAGDDLVPYLFYPRTSAEGLALEGVFRISNDGRWIIAQRSGRFVVLDTMRERELHIPDAATNRVQPYWDDIIALDSEQNRLLYLRDDAMRSLVIVDLPYGTVRELSMPSPIARIEPAYDGPWVALSFGHRRLIPADTAVARLKGKSCAMGPQIDDSFRGPRSAWLNIETGELVEDLSILTHIHDEAVRQLDDGEVRIGDIVLVPASCAANIYALAIHPLRAMVRCSSTGSVAPLELFGPDFHATLQGSVGKIGSHLKPERIALDIRTEPYHCERDACFAFVDGSRHPLPGYSQLNIGYFVISKSARTSEWLVTDLRSDTTTPLLPIALMHSPSDHLQRVEHLLVDFSLSPPRAVRILAEIDQIDSRGRLLHRNPPEPSIVPYNEDADVLMMPWGPVRWDAR